MHVHVGSSNGEAKFWIEPLIALAHHTGLSAKELTEMQSLVEKRKNEIIAKWNQHFGQH